MSVRIQLNNPQEHYTNLDYISGNVILSCPNEETVTAVTVKLEGESHTQLQRPIAPGELEYGRNARDRERLCRENHKILYKIAQVFPTGDYTTQGLDNAMLAVGTNYTLPPGQHSWPFQFRLPVNNGCASAEMQGVGANFGFGGLRLSDLPHGQMAYRHSTKTLPPTLTGFPNEAEIRYFVKVTVQRPGIWRENRRFQIPFRFCPIEPPRPSITGQETYARRSHTFAKAPQPHTIKRKPSLFTKDPSPKSSLSETPPSVSVDARLPNPAILTCKKTIPLRLLVKKQSESPEHVFLTNLQVELLSFTSIRAQDTERVEQGAWIILTKANLRIPISKPDDAVGDEMVVDGSGLWDVLPIPQGVLPSFQTCNISRSYQLEIKVGLGYGVGGMSAGVQPQSVVQLPLRFPVQVYSGIPPPPELLDGGGAPSRPQATTSRPPTGLRPPNLPARPGIGVVGNGVAQSVTPAYDPAYPPQLRPGGDDDLDAPPPSYEDAIAEGVSTIQQPGGGTFNGGGNNSNLGNGAGGGAVNGNGIGGGAPTATAGAGMNGCQSRVDSKS